MGDSGQVSSIEVNGFRVESNSSTPQEMRDALVPKDKQEEEKSKAAAELGRAGGKASAEKRAEAVEEEKAEAKPERKPIKPIPPKKEAKPEEKAAPKEDDSADEEIRPDETPDERAFREEGERRKHAAKERVLEATRKEAEAKRQLREEQTRRHELEQRLEAIERRLPKPEGAPEPKRDDGRPKIEDFDDIEKYLDADHEWREGQKQKQSQEAAIDAALYRQWAAFHEQFKEVDTSKLSPDILDLRTSFQLKPGEQETAQTWIANELFFGTEYAPALMLHLSEHPDEFQRIAALSNPRAVSRELAKLETRLVAATTQNASESEDSSAKPEEREVSSAHPPVTPISGRSHAAEPTEYKPGMTLDQYRKIWEKTVAKR